MTSFYDGSYYRSREEQARAMAERAHFPDIRAIHLDLAARYAIMATQAEDEERIACRHRLPLR